MRKNASVGAAVMALFLLSACGRVELLPFIDDLDVTNLYIEPSSATTASDKTVQYAAYAVYASGRVENVTSDVTWRSDCEQISCVRPGAFAAPLGSSGTITVTASLGNLPESNATLTVLGDIFVSTAGDDAYAGSDAGSREHPFASLEAALAAATAGRNVLVAAGDYATPGFALKEGVSIYGGFDPAMWARNLATFRTKITDSSLTGGSASAPKATVTGDLTITAATVLDGLELYASPASGMVSTVALDLKGADPVVRDCVLAGGFGTLESYGCILEPGATGPEMRRVAFRGGTAPTTTGFKVGGSGVAKVYACLVDPGSGATQRTGIIIQNSTQVLVYNCVILPGSGPTALAVGIDFAKGTATHASCNTILMTSDAVEVDGARFSGGQAVMCDNVIVLPSAGTKYGVFESTNPSYPTQFRNNDLFGTATAYRDNKGAVWTVAELNDNLAGADDNMELDPALDANGAFTAATPTEIRSGGVNGVAELWPAFQTNASGQPVDFLCRPRPATGNWSIGAYQE